jgi:myo-inositol-1(or 4)-monophosphatase
MNTDQLKNICDEVTALVEKVGHFIRNENGKVQKDQIEEKDLNSLVSYVDKRAEEMLVEGLQRVLPDAGFITEEDTIKQEQKEFTWIIDPLDGTTNFLNQIPHFSISVALKEKEELVVACILDVTKEEMFYAWKAGGAYLKGKQIYVSNKDNLKEAIIATGFPYELMTTPKEVIDLLIFWLNASRGIRRFGSAALDLAYVACGRFEMFYETTLNAWDVAAGILIVEEAGGRISDFSGGKNYLFGKQIVACNGHLYDEVMRSFSSNLNFD